MTTNTAYVPTDILSADYNYVSYAIPNNAIHTKPNEAYVSSSMNENQSPVTLPSCIKIAPDALNSNVSENLPLTDNPAYRYFDVIPASGLAEVKTKPDIETSSDYSYVQLPTFQSS